MREGNEKCWLLIDYMYRHFHYIIYGIPSFLLILIPPPRIHGNSLLLVKVLKGLKTEEDRVNQFTVLLPKLWFTQFSPAPDFSRALPKVASSHLPFSNSDQFRSFSFFPFGCQSLFFGQKNQRKHECFSLFFFSHHRNAHNFFVCSVWFAICFA